MIAGPASATAARGKRFPIEVTFNFSNFHYKSMVVIIEIDLLFVITLLH